MAKYDVARYMKSKKGRASHDPSLFVGFLIDVWYDVFGEKKLDFSL